MIAVCQTCGAEFERRERYGVPASTVNCPSCRASAKRAKPAAPAPPPVEDAYRIGRQAFVVGADGRVIDDSGKVVGTVAVTIKGSRVKARASDVAAVVREREEWDDSPRVAERKLGA